MSTNQRWAFQKKFQRGEVVINTKRFMGYDVDDDGELVINEAEAQIVRRIFHLYLDDMGMHRTRSIKVQHYYRRPIFMGLMVKDG